VLYDTDTRALLDNGQPFPSIASNSNLKPNPDGSADIYFGPTAPVTSGANWIRTVPGRGYFAAIRLYSPTQAYFDKVWKPGDVQEGAMKGDYPRFKASYSQDEMVEHFHLDAQDRILLSGIRGDVNRNGGCQKDCVNGSESSRAICHQRV
jgi:hypothetical protein